MKRTNLILAAVVTGCGAFSSPSDAYPQVAPYRQTIHIVEVSDAAIHVFIRSPAGQKLYELTCRSAGNPIAGFDFSGDFECRLMPLYGHTRFSTLFTEDPKQSRDWESRARFFGQSLKEPCASIDEFGSRRMFRLRGMALTLSIEKPVFDTNGSLKSIDLDIGVRPDPSARTPIAEHVKRPENAPAGCDIDRLFPR